MWTYLIFDDLGVRAGNSPGLPGPGTVYLGFDVCRMAPVLAYTERGGYHSILDPNVNDDCNIVAFAPLDEDTPPDMATILANGPWNRNVRYAGTRPMPKLFLRRDMATEEE